MTAYTVTITVTLDAKDLEDAFEDSTTWLIDKAQTTGRRIEWIDDDGEYQKVYAMPEDFS